MHFVGKINKGIFALFLVSILGLVSCIDRSKNNTNEIKEPNYMTWVGTDFLPVEQKNIPSPIRYMMRCRKVSDAKNVHYYYNLIVNDQPTESKIRENETTISIYENAIFNIEYLVAYKAPTHAINDDSSMKRLLFSLPVRVKYIELPEKQKAIIKIFADANTIEKIKAEKYYRSPYLKDLIADDLIMKVVSQGFLSSVINETEMDLPGLFFEDSLECI